MVPYFSNFLSFLYSFIQELNFFTILVEHACHLGHFHCLLETNPPQGIDDHHLMIMRSPQKASEDGSHQYTFAQENCDLFIKKIFAQNHKSTFSNRIHR